MNTRVIYSDILDSPVGVLRIETDADAMLRIQRLSEPDSGKIEPNDITLLAKTQLAEYFAGTRQTFAIPIAFDDASTFQKAVWDILTTIPYGRTISYMDIARKLNNPLSVRAVGLANGQNPIPIVVPCHRVIGSDRSLVGYAWGTDIKHRLLMLENPTSFGMQSTLF